jgi:hypothetical protein
VSKLFNTDKAIVIVVAVILTLAAILFLRGCIHTPEKPVIIPAKKIIATVKEQEKAPNIAIAKTDSNLVVLKNQVQTLTIQLAKAQQINRTLATHVVLDTATYYDAIGDYVQELIASAANADSICNINITNYQQQLSNRDTAYNWQVVKYNLLKNNFELATTQQQILEDSNKEYRRALRRKKFSNVIWKAALIAVGGFIILKK